MAISRRKFLRAGTMVAIAAGIPIKTGSLLTERQRTNGAPQSNSPNAVRTTPTAKADTGVKPDGLSSYTKATFAAYLNSSFLIKSQRTRAVEVKLIEVNDAGPVPDRRVEGKECFSLIFRGPQRLQQDVYTIEHAALGKFSLLLVPVGKDHKVSYYEALINRLN
jgi:hypothetical protein